MVREAGAGEGADQSTFTRTAGPDLGFPPGVADQDIARIVGSESD